jgi:ABC-type spermidine/putrescine transport system permease subunit I
MIESRERWTTFLFALPALAFMTLVFLYPLLGVLKQSVTGPQDALTLEAYRTLAGSRLFGRVLWNTFEISTLATVLTAVLAYPIALYLAGQPARRRAFLLVLVLLPFWTSILVKTFAFTVVLGENGLVNQTIALLPGIERGPKLLFNRAGVMIGLTHFFVPFMVFPILASLLALNPELARAAMLMGAGPVRIFLRITLPLSMPGVIAGALLTFILALGFFVTPALLGGRQDMMLANLVDFYTRQTLNWTVASAISVVLLALSLVLIFILSRSPGSGAMLGGRA